MITFKKFFENQGMPLPGTEPTVGLTGSTEDEILDDVGSQLRKVIQDRLIPAIDNKKLSRDKVINLLTLILQEFKNHYELSNSSFRTAFKQVDNVTQQQQ